MGTIVEKEVPKLLSTNTIKSVRVVNSTGEDLGRADRGIGADRNIHT
jgi:hypothetical protein